MPMLVGILIGLVVGAIIGIILINALLKSMGADKIEDVWRK